MKPFFLFIFILFSLKAYSYETMLKLYRPFHHFSQSNHIKTLKGDCLQQSKLAKREDAFRCQVDDAVYDPCFANVYRDPHGLYCPETPWNAAATQITSETQLDNSAYSPVDMSRGFPWGLVLEDGTHCIAIESEESIDQQAVKYQCEDKRVLIGHIQRCKPIWSILAKGDGVIKTENIQVAWF